MTSNTQGDKEEANGHVDRGIGFTHSEGDCSCKGSWSYVGNNPETGIADPPVPNVTPPIQPDSLDDILYEALDGTLAPHHIADIASSVWQWHQQSLERERLEGQKALLNDLADTGEVHHSVVDYRLEDIDSQLQSTLTNKDKDNKAQLAQPSKGDK